jgi:hypothetical protein
MENHKVIKDKLIKILKEKAGDLVKSNVKEGDCYTLPNTEIYLSKMTGIYKVSVPPYGTRVQYHYDLFYKDFYAIPDEDYEDIILKMKEEQQKKKIKELDNILATI